jgi:hypothetical protein
LVAATTACDENELPGRQDVPELVGVPIERLMEPPDWLASPKESPAGDEAPEVEGVPVPELGAPEDLLREMGVPEEEIAAILAAPAEDVAGLAADQAGGTILDEGWHLYDAERFTAWASTGNFGPKVQLVFTVVTSRRICSSLSDVSSEVPNGHWAVAVGKVVNRVWREAACSATEDHPDADWCLAANVYYPVFQYPVIAPGEVNISAERCWHYNKSDRD